MCQSAPLSSLSPSSTPLTMHYNALPLRMLRKKRGLGAFAVWQMLNTVLAERPDHSIALNDALGFELMAMDFGLPEARLLLIINECVRLGLFLSNDGVLSTPPDRPDGANLPDGAHRAAPSEQTKLKEARRAAGRKGGKQSAQSRSLSKQAADASEAQSKQNSSKSEAKSKQNEAKSKQNIDLPSPCSPLPSSPPISPSSTPPPISPSPPPSPSLSSTEGNETDPAVLETSAAANEAQTAKTPHAASSEASEAHNLSVPSIHDHHKLECLRASEWSETVRCRYHLVDHAALEERLTAFNAELIISGKRHARLCDYRQHFRNWMNRRETISASSGYSNASPHPPSHPALHTRLPQPPPQLSGDALHRVRMAEIAEFQRQHLARLAAEAVRSESSLAMQT